MDAFLNKVDRVTTLDISKMNIFFLKEKYLEFAKIKSENPNFTQGQICKMMGTSNSTIRRIRNDLGIPSKHKSKKKKSDRFEGLKSEGLKSEGLKSEVQRSEGLKSEVQRSEGLKSEGLKSEGLKSEGLKSEGLKSEGLRSKGKSFYCTNCLKTFKSSKNHVCKDTLASGTEKQDSDEELEKVLNRGDFLP